MGNQETTSSIFRKAVSLVLAVLILLSGTPAAWACPFCDPGGQRTLTEELLAADASVVAVLEKPSTTSDASASSPSEERDPFDEDDAAAGGAYTGATFRIVEVLRGENFKPGDKIEAVYFGEDAPDKQFVIHGVMGDQLDWGTPLPLSPRGVEYMKQLSSVPATGPDRLRFFMNHLEDADPLLAQDGYDEFARAPYEDLIAVKDSLDREQLVEWIMNSQVGPTHRRLYLTMLGLCGTDEDVAMLEGLLNYNYEEMQPGLAAMIGLMGVGGSSLGVPLVDELAHADVRAKQQCLDALLAAYLKLKGPEGLTLVENRFLKNPKADYTQLYSVIMALRFHGEESSEIPRERLVESLRLLLDNDEIADQVIPDLTRWEDWEVMDRLVEKFKSSDEDGWIRQPVVSYLLTAAEQPGAVGEKATAAVAELEEIDPAGVKRARTYLSWGSMPGTGSSAAAGKTEKESEQVAKASTQELTAGQESSEVAVAQSATKPKRALAAPPVLLAAPSRTSIIVVPLVLGAMMMGLFGVMLRGGHTSPPRTPTT